MHRDRIEVFVLWKSRVASPKPNFKFCILIGLVSETVIQKRINRFEERSKTKRNSLTQLLFRIHSIHENSTKKVSNSDTNSTKMSSRSYPENIPNVLDNAPFSSIKILSHHSSLSPMFSDINYLNSFMFLGQRLAGKYTL